LKRPKTAILIFRTGKMVCTGAKSEKEAIRAVRKVARELSKRGITVLGKPEIQNSVKGESPFWASRRSRSRTLLLRQTSAATSTLISLLPKTVDAGFFTSLNSFQH
jgi:hypothetical protein